jgi:FkbM family methyltransferase
MFRSMWPSIVRDFWALATARPPATRRAWAAAIKLRGRRLERRWPYLHRSGRENLNLPIHDILEYQLARSAVLNVIIVGAFDGLENDPLADFTSKGLCAGVCVEPQPQAFARLRDNIRSSSLSLVNAAVDVRQGYRTMFYVPENAPGMPAWIGQLASFDRGHIERHEPLCPGVTRLVRSIEVPTVTFDALLDRHSFDRLDVLQIDAEGYDAVLLKAFPFERLKPALILFEIRHMAPTLREEIELVLGAIGYALYNFGDDQLAVLMQDR